MTVSKENAAMAALDFVESGMTLGLGSGSTAEIFLERLGERIAGGLKVQGIPTSQRTADVAKENGVPLIEPDKAEGIDLTIDGADEVDPQFSLIKGGGAIEVDPFGMALTAEHIHAALIQSGCKDAQTILRQAKDGKGPLITDGGNYILDSRCKEIPKPADTAHLLSRIPGVMEHGLFIDLADVIIIGEPDHAKVMELARE